MDPGHPRRSYVLTHDLGTRVEAFRDLGLVTPDRDDPFFDEFRDGLEKRILACHPGAEIISVSMNDLARRIWAEAIRRQSDVADAIVVSATHDIAAPRRGHTLEINRLFDPDGAELGHGARPGHPTLNEQLRSLARLAAGNPVVLADDGAFTGRTVASILRYFEQARMPVSAVVLGLAARQGVETIRAAFDGELVCVEETPSLIDWMPDHDFVPFVPNCGRVVGIPFGDEASPIYTHHGAAFAVPYVAPFGDLEAWASVPSPHIRELSLWCLQQALELFRRIERMNDAESLTIRDLMGVRPAVCVPVGVGQRRLPTLDARVTETLSEACHELA